MNIVKLIPELHTKLFDHLYDCEHLIPFFTNKETYEVALKRIFQLIKIEASKVYHFTPERELSISLKPISEAALRVRSLALAAALPRRGMNCYCQTIQDAALAQLVLTHLHDQKPALAIRVAEKCRGRWNKGKAFFEVAAYYVRSGEVYRGLELMPTFHKSFAENLSWIIKSQCQILKWENRLDQAAALAAVIPNEAIRKLACQYLVTKIDLVQEFESASDEEEKEMCGIRLIEWSIWNNQFEDLHFSEPYLRQYLDRQLFVMAKTLFLSGKMLEAERVQHAIKDLDCIDLDVRQDMLWSFELGCFPRDYDKEDLLLPD